MGKSCQGPQEVGPSHLQKLVSLHLLTMANHRSVLPFVLLLLALSATEVTSLRLLADLANAGGVGLGNCPRSCLATCQAANFASTTSCTYTHVSRPFLGISESVTKACNVCYPERASLPDNLLGGIHQNLILINNKN